MGLEKDKILDLEKRKTIYLFVKAHPGHHFREIQRTMKVPASSLRYHLHFLTKYGLLSQENEGKRLRYFPREFTHQNKVLFNLLRQKSIRAIMLHLFTTGPSTHEQLSHAIGLCASTVSWHVKKLLSSNVILAQKKGRNTVYTLKVEKKELMALLITYKKSFFDSLVDKAIAMWELS